MEQQQQWAEVCTAWLLCGLSKPCSLVHAVETARRTRRLGSITFGQRDWLGPLLVLQGSSIQGASPFKEQWGACWLLRAGHAHCTLRCSVIGREWVGKESREHITRGHILLAMTTFSVGITEGLGQCFPSCHRLAASQLPGEVVFVFFFNWRIIALQYWIGFCHTSTWLNHRHTYAPSRLTLPPTSHPFPPL